MATKKRIKKKTYKEFMSWLEGVESMQEVDWVPNLSQWKTIREMLDNIKPEEIEVQQQQVRQQSTPGGFHTLPAGNPNNEPVARIVDPPAGFQSATAPVIPSLQSQLETPKVTKMPTPSGLNKIPNAKEAMLTPGEAHNPDEFL